MKVTVCELRNEPEWLAAEWPRLVSHVRERQSDLLLLPEMPFAPWMMLERPFDPSAWAAAVAAHDRGIARLHELHPAVVIGSRPTTTMGQRRNEAFVWDLAAGYRAAHQKYYLPDEPGYWEASWYGRGDGTFASLAVGECRIGCLVCSELWFTCHCREYARQGVHLLACPRATPRSEYDKWLAGGRAAAVMGGAFCLSSCRTSATDDAAELGGHGWIVGPNSGVIAETSAVEPFVTVDLRLPKADEAKHTYPRYIPD